MIKVFFNPFIDSIVLFNLLVDKKFVVRSEEVVVKDFDEWVADVIVFKVNESSVGTKVTDFWLKFGLHILLSLFWIPFLEVIVVIIIDWVVVSVLVVMTEAWVVFLWLTV